MFRARRSAALPLAALFLLGAACTDGSRSAAGPGTAPTDSNAQVGDAPTIPAQAGSGPRRITIIGDSISVGAADEYADAMPLDDVEVVATSGIRLGPQRDAIADAVADRPDVLVIELGTNDVPVFELEFLDEIDEVLAETDALPCVRWVTVYVPNRSDSVAAVNDHLAAALPRHDNLQLVDWFTLVDDDPGLMSDDGLHPNDEGQRVLAQAVAASTASCTTV